MIRLILFFALASSALAQYPAPPQYPPAAVEPAASPWQEWNNGWWRHRTTGDWWHAQHGHWPASTQWGTNHVTHPVFFPSSFGSPANC